METAIRNTKIEAALKDLLDAIGEGELKKSRELMVALEAELPADNLELGKARLLLHKQELRRAAH